MCENDLLIAVQRQITRHNVIRFIIYRYTQEYDIRVYIIFVCYIRSDRCYIIIKREWRREEIAKE